MKLRVSFIALCVGLAVAGATAAQVHAGVSAKAPTAGLPQGPCDVEHQWDIEIIDGALYECDCVHMMFGPPICDWMEITSQAEDPVRVKRIVRRARAKGHRVIARITPRPVATQRAVAIAAPTPAPAAGKCNDPYLADDAWSQQHGC